jgi:protein-L-isoaspartate(D-aspartate) O-methyltransferase
VDAEKFPNDDEMRAERHRMISGQLIPRGIHDERVLRAFEVIPRHLFVPAESHTWAYADAPQPIGRDQTISQPYIVALMSQKLHLTGSERVLDVGTGSGYQAAILSQLADQVHTVEIIPELAEHAKATLAQLGLANVQVHVGDGSQGWLEAAPYDAILVAAAAPKVPPSLLEQLGANGRLILPVGAFGFQQLEFWQRDGKDFVHETVLSVAFVPLRGVNGWPGR